jgi:hypothetical protein
MAQAAIAAIGEGNLGYALLCGAKRWRSLALPLPLGVLAIYEDAAQSALWITRPTTAINKYGNSGGTGAW